MTLPIRGYEGLYEISDAGDIRSLKRYKKTLRPWINSGNGYPMVTLHKDRKQKGFGLHRLLATHFLPNPRNLPQVNHIDSNPLNYRLSNLEWCTASYNQRFSYETNGRIVWNKGKKTGIKTKGCFKPGNNPWNKGLGLHP